MTHFVHFLCTGNYYRSRYAEELFNHLAHARGLEWRAFSRGAAQRGSPDNVGPMSRLAIDALGAKGITPEGSMRYPRSCSLVNFEEASLVIALNESEHRPLIKARFPKLASRVIYWHVDDIELVRPSIALRIIDDNISDLVTKLIIRAI